MRNSLEKHFGAAPLLWPLAGGLFLLSFGLETLAILAAPSYTLVTYLSLLVTMLYILVLVLLCFHQPRAVLHTQEAEVSGRRLSAPLLGAGLLFYLLGMLIVSFQTIMLHHSPSYPSPGHYLLFAVYPCFIAAFLLLPARALSLLARLCIFLDSLIILILLITLCYYFILQPMLTYGEGTAPVKAVGSAFPLADLVLIFCLLLVSLRSGEPALRPVLLLLGLATCSMFVTQIAHLYELLYSRYDLTSCINICWLFSITLFAGAARKLKLFPGRRTPFFSLQQDRFDQNEPATYRKVMIPYVLVSLFCLLVLFIGLSGNLHASEQSIVILYGGCFAVLILMVLRQLLTMYEISVLQSKLQGRNRALRTLHTELEQKATTDPLTGLPNHRTLVERLDAMLADARAMKSICSLIFMDIDHFKMVNDRYGHPAGDQLLRRFSQLVQSYLRESDCLGRWGGEEFVAILPGSDPAEALAVAEQIRTAVGSQLPPVGTGGRNITCSLGVATYPYDATGREDLIMRADLAMYTAKHLGRNTTRMAHDPLVLALGMSENEPETAEEMEMPGIVESLLVALETRDHSTSQHGRRVAALSLKLALRLGLGKSEAFIVSLGGLLHDLGKVGVPDAILDKRGGLSEEEHSYMAHHPVTGAEILMSVPRLQPAAQLVRAHHEHMDGSGYPDGLHGDEIPLGARIIAVADAYDAMTTCRAYRAARPPGEALRELLRVAGSQFDPYVVAELARMLSTLPQLSLVSAA